MKKVLKVLVAVGAVIGGAAGAVYLFSRKKTSDFSDFDDDDFEDIFAEDEEDRDYVTLDIEHGNDQEEESGETGTESTEESKEESEEDSDEEPDE